MKKKKEPRDMLIECLKDIKVDLESAEHNSSMGFAKSADKDIAKAKGRIENFLTILEYVEGE